MLYFGMGATSVCLILYQRFAVPDGKNGTSTCYTHAHTTGSGHPRWPELTETRETSGTLEQVSHDRCQNHFSSHPLIHLPTVERKEATALQTRRAHSCHTFACKVLFHSLQRAHIDIDVNYGGSQTCWVGLIARRCP